MATTDTAAPDGSPLVIAIVGATAVGKTDIALQLAPLLGAEIISADSRLFYRGMDVGTAKPSLHERSSVRHHLIDIVEPNETVSLAVFHQLAMDAIRDVQSRSRLPLVVGGTGQYLHALIDGWRPPAVAPVPRLRLEFQAMAAAHGDAWLHQRLTALDPNAASAIDPRNVRRTIRALEVIMITGRPFSSQRGRAPSGYQTVIIGLRRPRPELYARIDARIDRMFEAGILEETRHLLQQGYGADLPALSALGYRECIQVIDGALTIDEAKARMRRATRAFVRRQSNWFKESDRRIVWLDAAATDVVSAAEGIVRTRLARPKERS